MIELRFGSESLSRLRFAISPLTETFRSLRALDDPGSQAIHLPWAIEARRAVADLDLRVLLALLRPHDAYTPDFFAPPPAGPLVDIDDELAAVQAVGAERVRDELREAFGGRPLPDALIPLAERPERGLLELVELTRAYWDRTLAPHWPRLRALLTGDITYRARTLADGGAKALFSDIDPCVEWTGETLRLHKVWEESLDLDDRGLLLIPSAFVWPRVVVLLDPAWQPAVLYPARGVSALWEPGARRGPHPLGKLIGRRRAALLAALDQPTSTTDLAHALEASAPGISQHLAVLRDAGLVHPHRVGRTVLYLRTPLGDTVLDAMSTRSGERS
jgi:DNA-binding transcriptional ArsR family regulator